MTKASERSKIEPSKGERRVKLRTTLYCFLSAVRLPMLIGVVLTTAQMVPAIAQRQAGTVEATLTDISGRLLGGIRIDIDRTDPSSRHFHLKTDNAGRFVYLGIPPGIYSVKATAPDGEVLKVVPNIQIAGGTVDLTAELKGLPTPKSKRVASTIPTQPDIVKGCIKITGIKFQPASFTRPVGVDESGLIENGCGRVVIVTISVSYFDANGTGIDTRMVEQLVQAGGSAVFHAQPDFSAYSAFAAGAQAARYRLGSITNVFVQDRVY